MSIRPNQSGRIWPAGALSSIGKERQISRHMFVSPCALMASCLILATLFRSSQNKGAIYVFILVSAIERKPSRLAGLLINSEDQKMTIYLNSGRSRQPAS
ncbi:Uncharacterized protein TCM_023862 [Theobroma cacao]|uniref:Uncharacterized protein n=1 Tax=Theobroma cacao TaxID=3641 RepID=A0A061EVC2_THECC|nr:Uncharacterized protein TCM_023862 [Theobroma cacao]